ncbi:hypothetical protein ACIPSE_23905 [Streptomyces sp. NPDC090106]|uniref:hypothetical protein n=1 Tax=Streptomyces sp. NPDC090106 TaxID=3365946 RepID=UPI00382FCAFE
MIDLLLGLLVLVAIGGCVCVFRAERGGPRWVRIVARLTLAASDAARASAKRSRSSRSSSGDD